MEPSPPLLDAQVAAVRQFNRYYTRRIGLLDERMLGSDFSLPEMRILWELSQSDQVTASWLEAELGMHVSSVSRTLRRLREMGLLTFKPDPRDARMKRLRLTEKGRRTFGPLDLRSSDEVRAMLLELADGRRGQLVGAMAAIRAALDPPASQGWITRLRDPRPGDYGWLIERHGAIYAQEYGWDASFEGLVAEIVGRYVKRLKPKREQCWIAESRGERVGCVFLVERSKTVAQLRLLLVEPGARGHGIGRELVQQCVRTAHAIGYRRLILWTNDVLRAARHLYQDAGFKLVKQEKHRSFGHDLVGQYWELEL